MNVKILRCSLLRGEAWASNRSISSLTLYQLSHCAPQISICNSSKHLPFISLYISILLLKCQFYGIFRIIHVVEKQCLFTNDNTHLKQQITLVHMYL